VGSYITNSASGTLPFSYFDGSSRGIALDPACGCLSATDRPRVHAVGLHFEIRHGTKLRVAPTVLENQVRLPNLSYNPLNDGA
jgi:hypothetical protein